MHALHVLEFDKVREMLADKCDTPMGSALATALTPRFEAQSVWFEIDRTAEADRLFAHESLTMAGVRDVTDGVFVAEKGAVLDGATLHKVGESLQSMAVAYRTFITEWLLLTRKEIETLFGKFPEGM